MLKRCITSAIAVCVLVSGSGIANAQNWYAESTSLYWKRDSNHREFDYFTSPGGVDGYGVAQFDRLDPSQDLPFDFEWGHRYVLGFDNYNWSIEGVVTRVDTWHSALRRRHANDLHLHLDGSGTQNALAIWNGLSQAAAAEDAQPGAIQSAERLLEGFRYESEYTSSWEDAEFNFKIVLPMTWLRIGIGARYGVLDEFFNLGIIDGAFEDDEDGPDGAGELLHTSLIDSDGSVHGGNNTAIVGGGLTHLLGPGNGFIDNDIIGGPRERSVLDIDFDANVENHLVGAQMITQAICFENDFWILESVVKFGAFLNHVKVTLTETYYEENTMLGEGAAEQDVYQRVHADTKNSVAFLGNVRLATAYKLRENIRVKAGWEGQFISGVALAADAWQHVQADNFGRPRLEIDASETIFVHGGDLSLEVIW